VVFLRSDSFRRSVDAIQWKYVAEEGWPTEWFNTRWPHILEPEHEDLNLPPSAMYALSNWQECHLSQLFPWHYWHGIRSSRNLHSSQVLCLTLFGAFGRERLQFLEKALRDAGLLDTGEVILESEFEYEPENYFNEKENRRTSVDFAVRIGRKGQPGTRVYFEIKFLESGFGQCSRGHSGQCSGFPGLSVRDIPFHCLLTAEGISYWSKLPTLMDSGTCRVSCPVRGPFYQLMRNVLHLVEEGGRAFVVLSDTRAKYLDSEVLNFVRFLAPPYRKLVHQMAFQHISPYLRLADAAAATLLARKYGI